MVSTKTGRLLALMALTVGPACSSTDGATARPADAAASADDDEVEAGAGEDALEKGPRRTVVGDGPPMYPPEEDADPMPIDDATYGLNDDAPKAPRLGQRFPNFSLPTVRGGSYTYERARSNGPVMIVFYLGHWCPPCNQQLADIESVYQQIKFRDMTVIAISADARDDSINWISEKEFTFPMAVDLELRFIKKAGLSHPERKAAIHAIYMTDPDGKIFYAKVGGRRPQPQELLDAIDYHQGRWPPAR